MTDQLNINGIAEMIGALPALCGFPPRDSIVFVCLDARGMLLVTGRVDLVDAAPENVIGTLDALQRGGAVNVETIVFTDSIADDAMAAAVLLLRPIVRYRGLRFIDAVITDGARYRSLTDPECPVEGMPLSARALAEFIVADEAPVGESREDVERRMFDRAPEQYRPTRDQLIVEQLTAMNAHASDDESITRGVAELRAAAESWDGNYVDPAQAARFVALLNIYAARDLVWAIVDDRRGTFPIDYLRTLGRQAGPRLGATPTLLYGWGIWRHGQGMLANIAGEVATSYDPQSSLAMVLGIVLTSGMAPATVAPLVDGDEDGDRYALVVPLPELTS